jgi:hypothetical protein
MADEFGEEYSDLDISEQFKNWVLEVIDEIVTSGRWFFQNGTANITLVASQKNYNLAATIASIRDMRDPVNNSRVAYVPVERLIARGYDLDATGATISYWYIDSLSASNEMTISLYPVPNATAVSNIVTLKAHTLKRPAALTGSSTIPLPEEYIRAAKDGIRAKVRFNDGDIQGFQLMDQRFQQSVSLLNARFSGKPKQPSSLPAKTKLEGTNQMPVAPDGEN